MDIPDVIIGSNECPTRVVASKLEGDPIITENISKLANELGIPNQRIKKFKEDLLHGKITQAEMVYDILDHWRARNGSNAKLIILIQIIADLGAKTVEESILELFGIPSNSRPTTQAGDCRSVEEGNFKDWEGLKLELLELKSQVVSLKGELTSKELMNNRLYNENKKLLEDHENDIQQRADHLKGLQTELEELRRTVGEMQREAKNKNVLVEELSKENERLMKATDVEKNEEVLKLMAGIVGGWPGKSNSQDLFGIVKADGGLFVRNVPNIKGDRVRSLANGEKIPLLRKTTGSCVEGNSSWYQVRGGYVAACYILVDEGTISKLKDA